jgi:hypothetical protein
VHTIPRQERGGKLKQTWRLLSKKEQVRFHVLAADQEYDYPIAFGADLDPEEPVSIDDFHRSLAQHLKYRLHRFVEFIAVLDITPETGRRHFHGVVCCHTEAEAALAKTALEKASGKWRSRCHQKHQVWTKKLYTPRIWSWYICKTTTAWTKTDLLTALAKQVHQMQIRDEAQELARMDMQKSTKSISETDAPDTQEAPITRAFPTGSRIPARRSPPLVCKPLALTALTLATDNTDIIDDMDEIGVHESDDNDDLY